MTSNLKIFSIFLIIVAVLGIGLLIFFLLQKPSVSAGLHDMGEDVKQGTRDAYNGTKDAAEEVIDAAKDAVK